MNDITILPARGYRRSQRVLAYLDEKQIPYTRIELESEEGQALSEKHQLRSSPGILVNGRLVNPFDILIQPACRVDEAKAQALFGPLATNQGNNK